MIPQKKELNDRRPPVAWLGGQADTLLWHKLAAAGSHTSVCVI